ncbi:MAG: T9SS type A sorting domain-containing protein [Bacteroidetes bacterium]|nr:T9SS type A sorting domain-containing protein [Bacteroidota bacterium]
MKALFNFPKGSFLPFLFFLNSIPVTAQSDNIEIREFPFFTERILLDTQFTYTYNNNSYYAGTSYKKINTVFIQCFNKNNSVISSLNITANDLSKFQFNTNNASVYLEGSVLRKKDSIYFVMRGGELMNGNEVSRLFLVVMYQMKIVRIHELPKSYSSHCTSVLSFDESINLIISINENKETSVYSFNDTSVLLNFTTSVKFLYPNFTAIPQDSSLLISSRDENLRLFKYNLAGDLMWECNLKEIKYASVHIIDKERLIVTSFENYEFLIFTISTENGSVIRKEDISSKILAYINRSDVTKMFLVRRVESSIPDRILLECRTAEQMPFYVELDNNLNLIRCRNLSTQCESFRWSVYSSYQSDRLNDGSVLSLVNVRDSTNKYKWLIIKTNSDLCLTEDCEEEGCTDLAALNFNPNANVSTATCVYNRCPENFFHLELSSPTTFLFNPNNFGFQTANDIITITGANDHVIYLNDTFKNLCRITTLSITPQLSFSGFYTSLCLPLSNQCYHVQFSNPNYFALNSRPVFRSRINYLKTVEMTVSSDISIDSNGIHSGSCFQSAGWKNGIHVFPNPFVNEIFVHRLVQPTVQASLYIYNDKGQILFMHDLTNTVEYRIDTHFLEPGIYFGKIISQHIHENNASFRIVKLSQ